MLELLASDYRAYAQDILAYTICIVALIWGGGPERAVAVTWLILFEFAIGMYRNILGAEYRLTEIDLFLASTDILAALVWITVALYANRNYPMWIAGMQLLAMTAHVARGLVEAISPITYIAMVIAPGWFQLIFLGIGLSRHIMRKRKHGAYRDWRIVRSWTRYPAANSFRSNLVTLLGHDFFARRDKR